MEKIATQQSQKTQSLPPNNNVMYPIDAPMRPVKISPVLKILLTGSWAECKVLVNIYLYCQAGPGPAGWPARSYGCFITDLHLSE